MSEVEKQAARAEWIHKIQYPTSYSEEELKGVFDEQGEPNRFPGDTEEEEIVSELDQEDIKEEPKGEPTVDLENKQPDQPPKTEIENALDDAWKNKYLVLKGKYDAEVPRLSRELSELRETVSGLKKSNEPAPKQKTEQEVRDELLQDPDFKIVHDEFPEIFRMVTKYSAKISKETESEIPKELEDRIKRVEERQAVTAEERFANDLNRLVPDWADLNHNPEFVNWLKEEDEFTGFPRLDLALSAQEKLNGPRVAKFYSAFKESKGIANKEENDTSENDNKPDGSKKDMSKFVAPNSSKSKGKEADKEPEPITKEFINKFYRDASRGTYEGRDDIYKQIEAKINKAVADGKIIG